MRRTWIISHSGTNLKSEIRNSKFAIVIGALLIGLSFFTVSLSPPCSLLLGFCSSANAQQTGKIFRIGFLDFSTASGSAVLLEAFRQELRKLGWIEGKNITIEYRFAEQKPERLPELAADLVRLKVDLIVVFRRRQRRWRPRKPLLLSPS